MTKLFLSRIYLNSMSRLARRDLVSPYEMHRTVMRAFPDKYDGRVLFRCESPAQQRCPILYVQSDREADWDFLNALDGYLAQLADSRANPAQKSFLPIMSAGGKYFFRLHANPSVKRDGKRLALYREEDQSRWIGRKLEAVGARVLEMHQPRGELFRFQDKEGRKVAMLGVEFNGLLEVTSPDLLSQALADGIGSGKGFGFGLLSLIRAG